MEDLIKVSVVMLWPGVVMGLMFIRPNLQTEENFMNWAMWMSILFAIMFY